MLFKDLNKLKEYCDIANGASFKRLEPIMKAIEENSITQIIGKPLYTALNGAYTAAFSDDALEEKLKNLLHEVRKILGPLVCFQYAPIADINLNDSGLHRVETGTNKTAFSYQVANYRKAQLQLAEQAIEQLYEFLEENKATYPEWVEAARNKYRSLFIKGGREFADLFTSHSPYRNYYAMRSKMTDVELLYIKSAIGTDLFKYFKDKDVAGLNLEAAEAEAMYMIKKAIAYYTVAFAVPYLNVRIDEEGITVVSDASSGKETDKRKNADDNAVSMLLRNATSTAQEWLKQAKEFTAGWMIDDAGELVIPEIDPVVDITNSAADKQWPPIVIDCNGTGKYKAEDYNPRAPWGDCDDKGSFSM